MSDRPTTPDSAAGGEEQDRGAGNEWQGAEAMDSGDFQEEVDRRVAEKGADAAAEGSGTQSPQEQAKSELPVLEQRDDITADPGSTDA